MSRWQVSLCMWTLLVLGTVGVGQAQDAPQLRAELLYTPYASEAAVAQTQAEAWQQGARRNVALAFGLSALVPGLGQAYNRQWVQAAVHLGIEAAMITGYAIWRTEGLQGEDAFRAFAHASWSPRQYATWLNDYKTWLAAEHGGPTNVPDINIAAVSSIDFQNPSGWTTAESQQVRTLFNQIRDVERQMFHPSTGATFSHQLPYFAEQQYYELVGKYFQFAPGWDDYQAWVDGQGDFLDPIDPDQRGADGRSIYASDNFLAYAEDHAEANDLLRRASRLGSFFIVNHLIAGITAAVSAKLHNDRLSTNLGLAYVPDAPAQPVLHLRFRF